MHKSVSRGLSIGYQTRDNCGVFRWRSSLFVSIILCLQLELLAIGQDSAFRVTLKSSWTGLGPTRKATDTLACKSVETYSKKSRCASARKLLDLLSGPALEFGLDALGLVESWLTANVDAAVAEDLRDRWKTPTVEQIDLFRRAFLDRDLALRIFKDDLFSSVRTDEYPFVEITFKHQSGSLVTVSSQSQVARMAPWSVKDGRRGFESFDARISKAVFDLMPPKFTNRARLADQAIRHQLSEGVWREIQPQWGLLESKRLFPSQFETLSASYRLQKSQVAIISSTDVGGPADGISKAWHATLADSALPRNVLIQFSLPVDDQGQLLGFDSFNTKIGSIIRSFKAVRWLMSYVEAHPQTQFYIRFVNDRSFSRKARAELHDDLRKHPGDDLSTTLEPLLDEAVFIFANEPTNRWSSWLVLPDRRAFLWQFSGPTALGFKTGNLPSWERYGQRFTVAMIGPDGQLIK